MKWLFGDSGQVQVDKKKDDDSNEECRGAVRATRSVLAHTDPESKRPLLAENTSGLKKRPKTISSLDDMGTAADSVEPPLPDVVVRVGPAGRLSHSLPTIKETFASTSLQIVIPFFIAGIGMVGAGIYLDMVARWEVFIKVPEIIVLVPALLGLKGNLEMTLASRLSTEANLGNMEDAKEQWSMITANLILVQCQATVVGLLSSIVAVVMVASIRNDFSGHHTLLLCACSTLTASIASFILGLVTAAVIVLSKKMHINPDNIATPIAGSLGDITSLALLSVIADFFHRTADELPLLPVGVIVLYIAVMPFWYWISKNNKYTRAVLYSGWTPVIVAMLISTLGGMILDEMVNKHKGVAVFQPVINGVGGNLVSIQASRLSTALHQKAELGFLPDDVTVWSSPWSAFFSDTPHALTARVLMTLMVPGHTLFAYIINYFKFEDQSLTIAFLISYLIAAAIQVAILLYVAYGLTHVFWRRRINPDNSTIPYLTAMGDLLGIVLLGLTFEFLSLIGEPMTN
ncbi:solute carrier family 41 member 1 isoform X2 [Macrosteles quadrilineatus]|uniref:solute carrier family 41 member 1 isoform X2 n=1 Tax=Macrosteles quadrilineatus TaxID=74068 RepID=UPI0023E0BA9F|nr:solute carrier family 41 member 1 isoform X2 [Macrosteles quadrilineatus]